MRWGIGGAGILRWSLVILLTGCLVNCGGDSDGDGGDPGGSVQSEDLSGVWSFTESMANEDGVSLSAAEEITIRDDGQKVVFEFGSPELNFGGEYVEGGIECARNINLSVGNINGNFAYEPFILSVSADRALMSGTGTWTLTTQTGAEVGGTSTFDVRRESSSGDDPSAEDVVPPAYLFGQVHFGNMVYLTWHGSPSPNVVEYRVYRSGIPNPLPAAGLLVQKVAATEANENGVFKLYDNDPMLHAGDTYYYIVTAVNSAGVESRPSSQVKVDMPE